MHSRRCFIAFVTIGVVAANYFMQRGERERLTGVPVSRAGRATSARQMPRERSGVGVRAAQQDADALALQLARAAARAAPAIAAAQAGSAASFSSSEERQHRRAQFLVRHGHESASICRRHSS